MTTHIFCPKCGYQRTAEDDPTIPQGKCPSCDVYYAKYLDQQNILKPEPPEQKTVEQATAKVRTHYDNLKVERDASTNCPNFPVDISIGKQIVNWASDAAISGRYNSSENVLNNIPDSKIRVVLHDNGIAIFGDFYVKIMDIHSSQIINIIETNDSKSLKNSISTLIISFWDISSKEAKSLLIHSNIKADRFISRCIKDLKLKNQQINTDRVECEAKMTPEQLLAKEKVEKQIAINLGVTNTALICPHCHTKGKVHTKLNGYKEGKGSIVLMLIIFFISLISLATPYKPGGWIIAFLICGLVFLHYVLSSGKSPTQAHCENCNSNWIF